MPLYIPNKIILNYFNLIKKNHLSSFQILSLQALRKEILYQKISKKIVKNNKKREKKERKNYLQVIYFPISLLNFRVLEK